MPLIKKRNGVTLIELLTTIIIITILTSIATITYQGKVSKHNVNKVLSQLESDLNLAQSLAKLNNRKFYLHFTSFSSYNLTSLRPGIGTTVESSTRTFATNIKVTKGYDCSTLLADTDIIFQPGGIIELSAPSSSCSPTPTGLSCLSKCHIMIFIDGDIITRGITLTKSGSIKIEKEFDNTKTKNCMCPGP